MVTPPLTPTSRTALIVRIEGASDLRAAAAMPRGPERRAAAFEALRATAAETQQAALAALEPLRAAGTLRAIRSMFLPNALVVETDSHAAQEAVRQALTGVANVGEIRTNVRFLVPPTHTVALSTVAAEPPASWALDAVRAREAWASGVSGRGVTIGFIDSGADITHEALRDAYRGTLADGSHSHDHNWFDGIAGSAVPIDPRGHGTQVASVAVAPKIGIAPGARFIAARATADGFNSTVATLEALQWMLAPTRVDGTDPRPELGADIVNNSWGTSDGSDEFFRASYEGLKAAGIEVVTATGNIGPDGKVSAPASYPGFFSVGASDRHGQVADFSSRGPSPLPDAAGAQVPLIVAPGQMVPTAKPGDRYVYSTGTSIAAPITAGALAVLLEASPDATHEQLVDALTSTAIDIAAPGPDDDSGFGRIDLAAAVERIRT
jgi:subtilisin family serine protease